MDIQFVKHSEENAEVLFIHEGEVARADSHEHLVVFDDERRCVMDKLLAAVDDGGRQ